MVIYRSKKHWLNIRVSKMCGNIKCRERGSGVILEVRFNKEYLDFMTITDKLFKLITLCHILIIPLLVDRFSAVYAVSTVATGYCSMYSCAIIFMTHFISSRNSFIALSPPLSLPPRSLPRSKEKKDITRKKTKHI